jgi:hypothetical protein
MQFSAPLKEAAAICLGRPVSEMRGDNGFDREAVMPEWGFSVRHFLQVFGTECIRDNFGADFWVKKMRSAITRLSGELAFPVVITDCRFENEAEMIRSLGGGVIEIRRPGLRASDHASDAGIRADAVIINGGTLRDLADAIADLMAEHHAAATRRT